MPVYCELYLVGNPLLGDKTRPEYKLLDTFNDHFELVQDLKELYRVSVA